MVFDMRKFIRYFLCSVSILFIGASYPIPLPGTSGNVLTSDGSKWTSATSASAITSYDDLKNIGYSVTISVNTMIVALKQADGSTDCSTGTGACLVGFRSSTATSGGYSQGSFTASNSITLGTTDSIGVAANTSVVIYVYLVSDTTSEICLSATKFNDGAVQSASALTGGADTTFTALWCSSAHTDKPIKLIGQFYATFSNPNWGSIASVEITPPSVKSGSLGSSGTGVFRIEHTQVDGGTANTNCTTGTCTNRNPSTTGWVTVAWTATGTYSLTFPTGIFSATPTCVCGSKVEGTFPGGCAPSALSTSGGTIETTALNTGALANSSIRLICFGAR